MAVTVGDSMRIEPHTAASIEGEFTALVEFVAPDTSFRAVAVVTATALLGTEPAMGSIRLWDKTYNGFNQVRFYGTQTIVIHIPTVTVGDLIQITASPWVDDGGYWAGARVWVHRAEITLVGFADVPASPPTYAPPLWPDQFSVVDAGTTTTLTYVLGDSWGQSVTATAWRFRPLGADVWTTLTGQDTDGNVSLPFDLSASTSYLGIQPVDAYTEMQLGLSPLTFGATIGGGAGRVNDYVLRWDWDEFTAGDESGLLTIATTSDGNSSAGRYPVRLTRGETTGAYGVAGVWAIDNRTVREPIGTRYRPIGPPPNLSGRTIGHLRVTQTGSNLIGETSPDGITWATWFTEPVNLAQHTIVGANHGLYAELFWGDLVLDVDDQIRVHRYRHTGPSGVEVDWVASVDMPWLLTDGPGLDWATNGSDGGELVFEPSGAAVAFWTGVDGVVSAAGVGGWEVQGQETSSSGASLWGPTFVWTSPGGDSPPPVTPGGGGYGVTPYGTNYGN